MSVAKRDLSWANSLEFMHLEARVHVMTCDECRAKLKEWLNAQEDNSRVHNPRADTGNDSDGLRNDEPFSQNRFD